MDTRHSDVTDDTPNACLLIPWVGIAKMGKVSEKGNPRVRIIRLWSARVPVGSILPFIGFLAIIVGLLGMHTLSMDHSSPRSSFPAHQTSVFSDHQASAIPGHELAPETFHLAGTTAENASAADVAATPPSIMSGLCGDLPCDPQMVMAGCLLAVGTIFLIALRALPVNGMVMPLLRWRLDYRPIELERPVLRPSLLKLSISRT